MLQLPLLLLIVFYCNKTTAAIKPTLILITKYNKVGYNDLTTYSTYFIQATYKLSTHWFYEQAFYLHLKVRIVFLYN